MADRGEPGTDGCDGSDHPAANPDRCLHDHTEKAFGADQQCGQVESGDTLDAAVPQAEQPAVGEHDLQPEDRLAGDAVFGTEQPAGVRGDVSADRRNGFARGVRGEPQPVFRQGVVEIRVDDPGFHDGEFVGWVDLENAGHGEGGEHDLTGGADRAAGQAGADSPGDDGHAEFGGDP